MEMREGWTIGQLEQQPLAATGKAGRFGKG